MKRVGERCDPKFFYHTYRFFLNGWGTNDILPDGIEFEARFPSDTDYSRSQILWFLINIDHPWFLCQGVGLVTGVSGGSAAQNGVFHVLDAILGVRHESDFLEGQRDYMPAKHRRFVEVFAQGENVADLIRHLQGERGSVGEVA